MKALVGVTSYALVALLASVLALPLLASNCGHRVGFLALFGALLLCCVIAAALPALTRSNLWRTVGLLLFPVSSYVLVLVGLAAFLPDELNDPCGHVFDTTALFLIAGSSSAGWLLQISRGNTSLSWFDLVPSIAAFASAVFLIDMLVNMTRL